MIQRLKHLLQETTETSLEAVKSTVKRGTIGNPENQAQAQEVLNIIPPHTVPHPRLRLIEKARLSIRRGVSFHSIMIQRSEASRHLNIKDPVWRLDRKKVGYRFVDSLAFRRPQTPKTLKSFGEIDPRPGIVIKPVRSTGARGVFAIVDTNKIIDIKRGKTLTSWEQVEKRVAKLLSSSTRTIKDQWLIEELLVDEHGDLARDLKFFAFYGKVLFVQEIKRFPTFKATFWDRNGVPIVTGKPAELDDGYGISQEMIDTIEKISAEIPSPFVRIDTYRLNDNEIVFGEFTPRPGQFEEFNLDTDRLLGEEWLLAENRILNDALDGKKFTAFNDAIAPRKETVKPSTT